MKKKNMRTLSFLRGNKIGTKLLFWCICISIVPLIIIAFIASSSLKNALEVNELKIFYTIAESKNKQIVNYFQEQEKDLDVFSHSPIIIEALQAYESAMKQFGPESEQYRDVEKRFNEYFSVHTKKLGYYDLFLINREGDIVFTVKREDDFNTNLESGNYKNTELALALKQAIEKEKITLSKYKYYPPSDEPASFLVAPVYRNNRLKGALAVQLKIGDIFELMRDYSKLGETGEVLIGQKMGNEAVFINPLRFDPDAAFNRKVPFGSDLALPIQDAVQNKEGSGISIDYRGIPIIAVWRYMPGPNWGIVVKADKDEIFHSVDVMRNRFIITGLILILVAISIAIYLSRSISNPIKKLQSGIQKISQGNLKYKVGNDAPDEIGQLSRSFDDMTASLEAITASRDELNKEIRQRKEAQKEIRLLSKALEMNPSTVIITDREGVITYVNRKFTLETGFSFDEAVRQKPRIIKSNIHSESFYKRLWETILTGKEWNSEMQNKRKNGELFWQSVSISPIFIDSGEITHFVSNQVNITERKELVENLKNKTDNLEKARKAALNMMQDSEEQRRKAEAAVIKLEASQEEIKKLSQAIEQSPVTVGITDIKGNIEWVNKTFTDVTGYSADEVIGKNPRIFKSGKHPESFYKNLWETILSGKTWRGEFINKMKNGDLIWDSATISPLKNEQGKITHFIAIKEVITERKKAEEALRRSEDQIRLLLNSTAEGIYGVDLDGNCTFSNKSSLQLLGYERSDQLIRQNMHKLTHHSHADGTPFQIKECAICKVIQTGEGAHKDNEVFWRSDGTGFDAEYWSFPIVNDGKITGAVVTFMDITKRRKSEAEIKQAKLEAEKANLAKSEFLSRMSHELRTPLNSILGFAQLLEMGELNPKHKKGVKQIMSSGKHLLDLINEVLDLSRIEAGKLSLLIESVELSGIISEIIDIVRPLAAGSNLKLKTKDSPTNDLYVKADRQRLKQVLLNLINNAVKYNKEGGSVTIECTQDTGSQMPDPGLKNSSGIRYQASGIRISVTDTGIGISPDGIQKLFNPFQRIGSEISEIEGTGLGLAVAKKLTEAMQGTIGVESKEGEGSTFWIELPQSKSAKERARLSGTAKKQEVATIRKTGTILYIEDNISNVQLVKEILGEHRLMVRLVSDMYGKNAVRLANTHKPDFILLDMDLPDIHGSEVLKLLKANNKTKTIPIVILSADATPSQMEEIMKSGATLYLKKPLDVIEFLNVVDEILNKNKHD